VAIQNKDTQEGAVPPSGIFIILLVVAGIGAFWWNEFQFDEDALGEVSIYRTGGAGVAGHGKKAHIALPKVSSLKDCEKVVSEALKDYVDKQTAVIDEEEDEKPKKGKKGDAKKKAQDDDEDEVKSKKGKGKKK
jgi:hypothetical protein